MLFNSGSGREGWEGELHTRTHRAKWQTIEAHTQLMPSFLQGSFCADGCVSVLPVTDADQPGCRLLPSLSPFYCKQSSGAAFPAATTLSLSLPIRPPGSFPRFHPVHFPLSCLSHSSVLLSLLVTHSSTSLPSIPEELPYINSILWLFFSSLSAVPPRSFSGFWLCYDQMIAVRPCWALAGVQQTKCRRCKDFLQTPKKNNSIFFLRVSFSNPPSSTQLITFANICLKQVQITLGFGFLRCNLDFHGLSSVLSTLGTVSFLPFSVGVYLTACPPFCVYLTLPLLFFSRHPGGELVECIKNAGPVWYHRYCCIPAASPTSYANAFWTLWCCTLVSNLTFKFAFQFFFSKTFMYIFC